MKKWPLLFAALTVVMIGCAGGGDGGTTTTNGGNGGNGNNTTGRSTATVNLGNTDGLGLLDLYFLPGQGRAPGSPTAVIGSTAFQDVADSRDVRDDNPLQAPLAVRLDGFAAVSRPLPILINNRESRQYVDYRMTVNEIRVEQQDGSFITFTGPGGNPPILPVLLPNTLQMSVFEGRVTALQIFLNDAMLNHDGNDVVWDPNLFLAQNRNPSTNRIQGFISDYVTFDISNVPVKPQFDATGPGAGKTVGMVGITGDSYGLGVANPVGVNGSDGYFEALTPFNALPGFYRPQDAVTGLKTYELQQNDPRFIDPPRLIASLKGVYRNVNDVVSSMGEVEFISFPKTGDGAKQEIALIQRNGNGVIVNMWFGQLDFSVAPNPTFRLFSIDQLQPATTNNPVTGTIAKSSLRGDGGAAVTATGTNWWQKVRSGDFTIANPPAGFPATFVNGRFIVFRK